MTYEEIKSKICNLKKGKLPNGKWYSPIGDRFEKAFELMCQKNRKKAEKSSDPADIVDHIDYWVNGTPVDVKSPKHRFKKYDDFPKQILVELVNVNGYAGWLRGKSKYIVFGYDAHPDFYFLIYDREKLLAYVESLDLPMTTRNNRQDKYTWIDPPEEGLIRKVKCNEYLQQALEYYGD